MPTTFTLVLVSYVAFDFKLIRTTSELQQLCLLWLPEGCCL